MLRVFETKVAVAAASGGVGGALATFLLWVLGTSFWGAPSDAGHADVATAAVPAPVAGLLLTLLPAGLALLGGWLAPHTGRTAPAPSTSIADTPPVTPVAVAWPPTSSSTPTVVTGQTATTVSTDLGPAPSVTASTGD